MEGSMAVRPRRSLSVGLGEPDPLFVVAAAAATERRSVSLVVVERLSVEPSQNTARQYRGTMPRANRLVPRASLHFLTASLD